MRSVFIYFVLITSWPWFVAQSADPTQPPGWMSTHQPAKKQVIDRSQFNLQQILSRNGRRIAVINNQLVKTGDKVAGAKVIAIQTDSVVLNISQKRLILSLLNKTKVSVSRSDNRN